MLTSLSLDFCVEFSVALLPILYLFFHRAFANVLDRLRFNHEVGDWNQMLHLVCEVPKKFLLSIA
jgi:hypothetical protein